MFEKRKEKKKKIYHFASASFSKDMLRIVKGFAPWSLFDCFEEKFLYPLECWEVPSGSRGQSVSGSFTLHVIRCYDWNPMQSVSFSAA